MRSAVRSTIRSLIESASRSSAGPYDIDAQSYFARAEALGGSFDLTGINGTYTAAYVKNAINEFVKSCKSGSIWNNAQILIIILRFVRVFGWPNVIYRRGQSCLGGTTGNVHCNGSTIAKLRNAP